MGAVYKARDVELNRMVALKVIRPDLATNQSIIDRFKQELLLATQVTHKNVIRIYDLSEADGMKFITMEYVEGEDLRGLMQKKGKLAPEEAVEIMQQTCRALEAAHSAGIIHRDLKPQNIMRDKTGRVLVMDFGLARTLEGDGMTQTGALVGTMDYMSPEQALGKDLDQRSDVFALGLIFYELLTGKMPYKADSVVASLLKRTQERATPVSSHDASIPRPLSNIVGKCMEPDVKLRYQSSAEILADLEAWQGGRAAATLHFPSGVRPWGRSYPWHWFGAAAAVVVLAIVGFLFRGVLFGPRTNASDGPVVSLAILPFRNASGDASLNWLGPSLADMLSTDVGQSAHLRTVSPERLHQVLADLRISPDASLDPTALRHLAEFISADTLVWGQYAKFGDQIRIDAALQDLKHDRRVPLKIDAVSEKDIPGAVDRLAASIRQNLSVSPDVIKELQANSFQPSSKSAAALREYNQGVQLLREGKNLDAKKVLEAATKEDPGFASAFSKLAQAYSNLGYGNDAEQYAEKAVELAANLSAAERYLITASHAHIARDYQKAIESYENLAKLSPDNADVQLALARTYEDANDFANARQHYQKVLQLNPKDITAMVALGRVELKNGNPQASLEPLTRALSLSVEVDNQEQRALVLHLLGIAYANLNKPDEALRNYQQALEVRRGLGQKQGIADTTAMIAQVYDALGKSDSELKSYNDALEIYREIGDKPNTAIVLLNLGQFYEDHGKYDEGLKLFKQALLLEREVGNENNQALCLNNIGNTYLSKADYENARTYFEQALQLFEKFKNPSDIADALHNLAETDLMTGQYAQALARLLRALELRRSVSDKQGAAKESDSMGILFGYQGRYGAALKSREEGANTFRELKDRSYWMAYTLTGYGDALVQVGRFDDAAKVLTDAMDVARGLKNQSLVAQISERQGISFLERGDLTSAKPLLDAAVRAAAGAGDHQLMLETKLATIKLALKQGQTQAAIQALKGFSDQADAIGLKYLAVEASGYYAEALMGRRDYPHAEQELRRALELSEKLGMRMLSARNNFLFGEVLRSTQKAAEAAGHYREAAHLIDEMRKEPGAETLLQRPDLQSMYTDASRWSQSAKN
jgi:eukaryotic-like serine/threonine-protein kinase